MAIVEKPSTKKVIDGIELTAKTVTQMAPPKFATVEQERQHRKEKLAGAMRIFGRLGFGEGVAGHITVRDPEFPDHFWVEHLYAGKTSKYSFPIKLLKTGNLAKKWIHFQIYRMDSGLYELNYYLN